MLLLLLVVLPLQSVGQLVAGIQAHRHLHTGAATSGAPLASLGGALRAVLDRLHAAQDPRLELPPHVWQTSRGTASGLHAHGGVHHEHSHATDDVLDVSDPADASQPGAATVFLSWLPGALTLPVAVAGSHPAPAAEVDWRDRLVAPPLAPPRA